MTDTTTGMSFPIAAVERDTGLGKDTLRAWERRYGFPVPIRDHNGDRLYPAQQVARLRTLKRLLDKGHRPGKLLGMTDAELAALAERAFDDQAPWGRGGVNEELASYLEECRLERAATLRRSLMRSVARLGLRRFVLEIAAPMVTAVGDCWERGTMQVYEEHLFTETMQNVLRCGIAALPGDAQAGPVILLATFPQEKHALGLLMAEAMFALEGANCISLGTSTPVGDIARAAAGVDVVALSFSIGCNSTQMLSGLSELASQLPPQVQIWCGGAAVRLARCGLPAFRHVDLANAGEHVQAWHKAQRS